MFQFVLRTAMFLSLLCVALGAALWWPNQENAREGFLGGFLDKQQHLQKMHSGKIIFVGGSNLAFGLNTKRVSDHFDRPAINLSTHSGLGLKFMLDSMLPAVSEGDTVVIIPEYAHFVGAFWGKRELAALIVDVDRQQFKRLSTLHLIRMIPAFATYAAKNVYASLGQRPFPQRPTRESVYQRSAFNDWGDIQAHWGRAAIPISKADKLDQSPRLDDFAFAYLDKTCCTITNRGARWILLPPVFRAASFDNQRPLIEAVEHELFIRGISFAAACERYRFDNDLFFDSHYHLTRRGCEQRTGNVIEDIDLQINADVPAQGR